MFNFGKKKKNKKLKNVDPTASQLELAASLVDQVNELYQNPDWPRGYRIWFDLDSKINGRPRLTIQEWQPAAAAKVVYPSPDWNNRH